MRRLGRIALGVLAVVTTACDSSPSTSTQDPPEATPPTAKASETPPVSEAGPSEAEPSKAEPSKAEPAEAEPASAKADVMNELYVDGFYRSKGGTLITAFPPSIHEDGTLEISESNGARMLVGKSEDGVSSFFTVLPPGDYDSVEAANKVRADLAASMKQSVNLDELQLRSINELGPGGRVYGFRHGPAPNGAIATIALIVDGRDAALLLVLGQEQPADAIVTYVVDATRVGSKVPRLEDKRPAQRIEGTYSSRVKARNGSLRASWMMFDSRGYAHDSAPTDDATLDMAAMVQAASIGLARAYSYEVRNGNLELTPLRPGDNPDALSLTSSDRKLVIDGTEYNRVDGLIPDGTTYAGVWEYYSGTSIGSVGGDYMSASTTKRFSFGPGNQISFRGGTSIIGNTHNEVGLLDSTTSGYVENGTWSGTYRVEDGKLIVKTTDGVTLTRPLAVVLHDGKPSTTSVTIGGLVYNKEE